MTGCNQAKCALRVLFVVILPEANAFSASSRVKSWHEKQSEAASRRTAEHAQPQFERDCGSVESGKILMTNGTQLDATKMEATTSDLHKPAPQARWLPRGRLGLELVTWQDSSLAGIKAVTPVITHRSIRPGVQAQRMDSSPRTLCSISRQG